MSATTTPPEDREARETAVVDLLASWSATAHPESAALLRAIAGVPRAVDLLREMHTRGRDIFSAEIREEIEQAITIMGSGASLNAPSFRARLDQLFERARDALQRHVSGRGTAVASQLRSWALLLEREDLDSTLRGLWRSEVPGSVADLISAGAELDRIQASLEAGRHTLTAEIESRTSASADRAPGAATLERARAALEGGDPLELYRARLVVQGLEAREKQRALAAGCSEAAARVTDLVARVRQLMQGTGGGPAQLLAESAERAGSLAQSGAAVPDGSEALHSALQAWERSLRTLLGGDAASADDGPRDREAIVKAFQNEVRRLTPRQRPASGGGDPEVTRQAAATLKALQEAAPAGGRPFQEAVERASALLQGAKSQAGTDLKVAGARVQTAAADLASFLEKTAEQLPTTRVIEARLRLEQVAGIVATGYLADLESTERAFRDELDELRRLAAQAQRRRSNREEAERESLRSEAARVAEVAGGRLARRFEALAVEADQSDEDDLADLRDRLERLRSVVEQDLRLRGSRALFAGRRWARKAGQRASARNPERFKEVSGIMDDLSGALQKDDLVRLRDCTAAARSALSGMTLTARPWFRGALAGAALLLVAGGLWGWRQMGNRPQTYHLTLTAQPESPVSVWLVRDGEIVDRGQFGGGNNGVRFDLYPGRYEVFVNERYTGRVVSVPGQKTIDDIPLPGP